MSDKPEVKVVWSGAMEHMNIHVNGKDVHYTNFDEIGSDGMREIAAILKKVSKSLKIKFVEDEE